MCRYVTVQIVVIMAVMAFNKVNVNSADTVYANSAEGIRNLALKFGMDISKGSEQSTCFGTIAANFKSMDAKVAWIDAHNMMDEMRTDVLYMMNWKKQSVEKIANESERLAANYTKDKEIQRKSQEMAENYYNMKRINDENGDENSENIHFRPLRLSKYPNFDDAVVNVDTSAVHVPTDVYENGTDILNDIKWSEQLTSLFKNNMQYDPALSWQFFGSSTGFLRLFPATKWRSPKEYIRHNKVTDFYDCRMRPWYIQAAASSKDVVVLIDTSGSMTGLRKEIAKKVAYTILDTLTDDDYVAVLNFSLSQDFIPKCFNDTLVQANMKNIIEIKEHINHILTSGIANFKNALIRAFELLQRNNKSNLGAQCNQAIMLITDGAPDSYKDVFERFNVPNIPIRVFTYLIGREVTDSKQVHLMACSNRGYYTHVANLAEVREQVQQYLPVMSRPIVLARERVFIWTPVYADVVNVQISDWVLEERAKAKKTESNAMQHTVHDRQIIKRSDDGIDEDYDIPREFHRMHVTMNSYKKERPLNLMTTVATPVLDQRNCTNKTIRELVKNTHINKEVGVRIANLLGVAGVDVPIKEIAKLMPQFKLGVNGYSFMITNNGYLLYHPDLRPLHQDMLKPFYSSVDIAEVELADVDSGAREFDDNVKKLRGDMVNRTRGWRKFDVKVHLDNMRRVVSRMNYYVYGKIDETPFSLAIVLPEQYGSYRVEGQIELKRNLREENFTHYFRGNQWRVHPDWVYCEHPRKPPALMPSSPEESVLLFLKSLNDTQTYRWKTTSTRPQVFDKIFCDKDLVQSLVFDAKATDIGGQKKCDNPSTEDQTLKMFGVVTTFVATRSGLTRFEDHRTDEEKLNATETPFYEMHNCATEEIYYKRAVDFYAINSSAFVFSVPFSSAHIKRSAEQTLVTGSKAIFIGTPASRASAPVAVVGLQIKYMSFWNLFFNLTKREGFRVQCNSDELDCYLLDNNAYVVLSESFDDTGKLFSEIDHSMLEDLVSHGIYRKIHMYDYQAMCFEKSTVSGLASMLITPLRQIYNIFVFYWTQLTVLYFNLLYNTWNVEAMVEDYQDNEDENVEKNNIKPLPCDKEFDLYEMKATITDEPINGVRTQCHQSGCQQQYIIQYVPYTNLVMLAIYKSCPCPSESVKYEHKTIEYSDIKKCDLLKTEKYRKRPSECHNYHPQEREIKECGGGSALIPSLTLVLSGLIINKIMKYT